MTGHRHSTRTPGLLGPAKKFRDFRDPRATETYFTSLARSRRKKGPASVLKKWANVRARARTTRKGSRRKESAIRRWSGPGGPSKTAGSHYEHIKKPQGATHARVPGPTIFRSIYATSNVNKPRSSLYPSFFIRSPLPSPSNETTPRLFFFCLSSAFPRLSFSLRAHVRIYTTISTSVSVSLGSDQSMQDFCVDLLDWGTALPSMGTKTCRQHREQETTNCCKLRNTNAHLSRTVFQPRVLRLSRAFFCQSPVFCPTFFFVFSVLLKNACSRLFVHTLGLSLSSCNFVRAFSPMRARGRSAIGFAEIGILIDEYRKTIWTEKIKDELSLNVVNWKFSHTTTFKCCFYNLLFVGFRLSCVFFVSLRKGTSLNIV